MATKQKLEEELKSIKGQLGDVRQERNRLIGRKEQLEKIVMEQKTANKDLQYDLRVANDKIEKLEVCLTESLDKKTAEFFKTMILEIVERLQNR